MQKINVLLFLFVVIIGLCAGSILAARPYPLKNPCKYFACRCDVEHGVPRCSDRERPGTEWCKMKPLEIGKKTVCASDLNTYRHPLFVAEESCKMGTPLFILHKGPCPDELGFQKRLRPSPEQEPEPNSEMGPEPVQEPEPETEPTAERDPEKPEFSTDGLCKYFENCSCRLDEGVPICVGYSHEYCPKRNRALASILTGVCDQHGEVYDDEFHLAQASCKKNQVLEIKKCHEIINPPEDEPEQEPDENPTTEPPRPWVP